MKLKDVIEDVDGNPKDGDILELMKKELKRMNVVENREEPLGKKEKTYFSRNGDNRSRLDN